MGLFTYLSISKVAAMVDSAADTRIFLTRPKPAGKPSGLGNHTRHTTRVFPYRMAILIYNSYSYIRTMGTGDMYIPNKP